LSSLALAQGVQTRQQWEIGIRVAMGGAMQRTRWWAGVVAVAGLVVEQAQAQQYMLQVLEPLPGHSGSSGNAVNNSGQVVGYSFGGSNTQATAWTAGTPSYLTILSGASNALAINDLGQAAGFFDSNGDLSGPQAAVWSGGMMTIVGPDNSYALGINLNGWTVGAAQGKPVRWTDLMRTLNPLPGGSGLGEAYAINHLGWAAGWTTHFAGDRHAVYWGQRDGLGSLLPTDLGTLGGRESLAYAVNDAGQAAGFSQTTYGTRHAFLATVQNGMVDLGTLGGFESIAYGINSTGQVVGQSDGRGFLWSQGTMTDLNDLVGPLTGWEIIGARDINDSGQIIAFGRNSLGIGRALLLSQVPEPSSLLLISLGGMGFILGCRAAASARLAWTAGPQ
jgi:probable HAF family extracellular repeat protein